jgi:DNA-binding NarL/FixJ family response regulator
LLRTTKETETITELENMTLNEIRKSLKNKGHFNVYDILSISLLVYELLAGKNTSIIKNSFQEKEVKTMLFAHKYNLTNDQMITLRLIAQGCTNQEIADNLDSSISLNGVSKKISTIYKKLNVRNRQEALAKAIKNEIV